MAEWRVERVSITVPDAIEKKLNELEETGFEVIQVVPTEKHLLIIARKGKK